MTHTTFDYILYYWPVPFRGHFIRAILTYVNANWDEGEEVGKMMSASPSNQPIPFMGPPMLIVNKNNFSISQMPAIAFYLGETFNLLPNTSEGRALTQKVINDANDVIDEITLQGGMEMWTDEKWQAFVPRLKRWMSFWEVLGKRCNLTADTGTLLGTTDIGIADIVTATLWMTMRERFPSIGEMLDEEAPYTAALAKRLWEIPIFDKFSKNSFEKYGNSYCGGQIEKSLRKVVNHE